MKVEKYFITENSSPELSGAVEAIMRLFQAELLPAQKEDAFSAESRTDFTGGEICVTTKISHQAQIWETKNKIPADQNNVTFMSKRLAKLNTLTLMRQITGTNPSPWGILSGVRPGKIADSMLDDGLTRTEIIDRLVKNYGVSLGKAEILTDIAIGQQSFFQGSANLSKTVSIYIGIPYCHTKCLYCSFPSAILPKNPVEVDIFCKALKIDIEAARRMVSENDWQVESIYIGGGTPTCLSGPIFAELLETAARSFLTRDTREFTVEAGRPDSMDGEKIAVMRRLGVTRVSVNPQTFNDRTLALIGRSHTVADILDAFQKIRQAQIPMINMDIIAGLPGENEEDMVNTMARLEHLEPDNITVHTLAVKRGALLKDILSGAAEKNLALPDASVVENMLRIAQDAARQMQMRPYYLYRQKYTSGNLENTGYAKSGAECIYNMRIISERQTIIGIGPSAATKVVSPSFKSCYNPKDIPTYVQNMGRFLLERGSSWGKGTF